MMQEWLNKLQAFYLEKEKGDLSVIGDQLKLIRQLEKEENKVVHLLPEIEKCVREKDTKKYNIDVDTFLRLMREKDVAAHIEHHLSSKVSDFEALLQELKKLFKTQQHVGNQEDITGLLEREVQLYQRLQQVCDRMDSEISNDFLQQYFQDIRHLSYKKSWMDKAAIFSVPFRKALLHVYVEGLNNIPRRGPCILAPRHYFPVTDYLVLTSIIPRRLFFMSSVEGYAGLPSIFGISAKAKKLMSNLGMQFVKRDDAAFERQGMPRAERTFMRPIEPGIIEQEPIDQNRSIKNLIIHLKHGDVVVVFPEGDQKILPTYDRGDKEFIPAQQGFITFIRMAEKATGRQIPILPIGISAKGGLFNIIQKMMIIRIGPQLFLSNIKKECRPGLQGKKLRLAYANKIMSHIVYLSRN